MHDINQPIKQLFVGGVTGFAAGIETEAYLNRIEMHVTKLRIWRTLVGRKGYPVDASVSLREEITSTPGVKDTY